MTDSTATPGHRRPSDRELASRALLAPAMDDNTRAHLWRIVHRLERDTAELAGLLDRFGPRP